MSEVMRAGAQRKGIEVPTRSARTAGSEDHRPLRRQSDAFYTSGRMLDDGIIDPRDTRKVLGFVSADLLGGAQPHHAQ